MLNENSENPGHAALTDEYGRHLHKLRVQLTDACNLRCIYCMPEDMRFLSPRHLLTPDEIATICRNLHQLGVDELRITGGEPTVRGEFDRIATLLADIPWKSIGLTTNGITLQSKLALLSDIGLTHLNVSLDTLKPERFFEITRRDLFRQVLDNIHQAVKLGFHIKINCVLVRGFNEDEIQDFLGFAAQTGIEVRFLELMKVGPGFWNHEERFISAAEVIQNLKQTTELVSMPVSADSTSFVFKTSQGARIGFIASESQPFCGTCSRLRLTATGQLRACLFTEEGVDLRGQSLEEYPRLMAHAAKHKPTGRLNHIHQPMNQIGG